MGHTIKTGEQGQKEIAACAESRFFPLFATNFMYSLMYGLLKIAVSRFLGKIIAIFFCPCRGVARGRLAKFGLFYARISKLTRKMSVKISQKYWTKFRLKGT